MTNTMHIKIGDFGCAQSLPSSEDWLAKPAFAGTPEYVSPEMLDAKPISSASDAWSVGCVLYYCLTGSVPFKGANDYFTMELIVSGEFQIPDLVPPVAADLIRKLLVVDPEKRLGCPAPAAKSKQAVGDAGGGSNGGGGGAAIGGIRALRAEPFFSEVMKEEKGDWDGLHERAVPLSGPFLPPLADGDPHPVAFGYAVQEGNQGEKTESKSKDKCEGEGEGEGKTTDAVATAAAAAETPITADDAAANTEAPVDKELEEVKQLIARTIATQIQAKFAEYETAEVRDAMLKEQIEHSPWQYFLEDGSAELIVKKGAVKRRMGLVCTTVQLVLTDRPRLLIMDPDKMKVLFDLGEEDFDGSVGSDGGAGARKEGVKKGKRASADSAAAGAGHGAGGFGVGAKHMVVHPAGLQLCPPSHLILHLQRQSLCLITEEAVVWAAALMHVVEGWHVG